MKGAPTGTGKTLATTHSRETETTEKCLASWSHDSRNQTSIDCTSYSLLQYTPEGIQITTGGHKSALIRPNLSSKCWIMTRAETTTTKLTVPNKLQFLSLIHAHCSVHPHCTEHILHLSDTLHCASTTARHLRETTPQLLLNSSGKAKHHPTVCATMTNAKAGM